MKPKPAFVADFIGTTSIVSTELAMEIFTYNSAFSIRQENIALDKTQDYFNIEAAVTDIPFQVSYYQIS